jgi:exosortase N
MGVDCFIHSHFIVGENSLMKSIESISFARLKPASFLLNRGSDFLWPMIFLIALIGISAIKLKEYTVLDAEYVFSFMLTLLILKIGKKDLRYIVICFFSAILLFALFYFLGFSTFYYFGFWMAILFVINAYFGTVNVAFVFLLAINSPIFTYALKVFGLPIRLWISKTAASIIARFGNHISVDGINVILDGRWFGVEASCTGLNMLVTALALSLALIRIFTDKYQKKDGFSLYVVCISFSMFFVIVSNLIRVILLILFNIKEDSFLHELIGLMTFGFYCMLPMIFLTKYTIIHWSSSVSDESNQISCNIEPHYTDGLHAQLKKGLMVLLIFAATSQFGNKKYNNVSFQSTYLDDWCKEEINQSTVKYFIDEALIYIKAPASPFSPDHNPSICWKGSGYHLKQENILNNSGQKYYYAKLVKENEVLHTAWWYSDGEVHIIDNVSWRIKMLRDGKNFDLINVTSTTRDNLDQLVKKVQRPVIIK